MKKTISLKQRVFAILCLILVLNETVYSTTAFVISNKNQIVSSSGNQPVSDNADSMVDLYTGDFKYSVPLLNVPGPNGENVSVSANYSGGIKMNQKASWLGLGWDYNPGEITRNIVGAPDDYSGQPIAYNTNLLDAKFNRTNFTFGPFNYEKINGFTPNTAYSTSAYYNSEMKNVTDVLTMPTYFKDPENWNSPIVSSNAEWYPNRLLNVSNSYYRAPAYDQYFVSGPGIGGNMQPYILSGNTGIKFCDQNSSSCSYTTTKNKTQFYFDNSTYKKINTQADNSTTNRIKSGYFVKYYTNSEINNSSNLFSNTTQTGFLDYRVVSSGSRRTSSGSDLDGIGGIEITNPNGLTYHYSLPVYSKEQLVKTFQSNTTYLTSASQISKTTLVYTPERFATSWKLTAVTGTDYFDSNNNKVVDQGDSGYWVAYKYSKWQDEFSTTNAHYNYMEDYGALNYGINVFSFSGNAANPIFTKNYNVSTVKTQIYYLDYIQTSTHTAFFIKNYRNDEHNYSAGTKVPLLKLDKIVLLRNESKNLLLNSNSTWDLTGINSNFNASSFNSAESSLIHLNKYNVNKTQIDQASLKSVEFNSDYSLCRKLWNNIQNTVSSTAITPGLTGPAMSFYNSFNNGSYDHFKFHDHNSASVTSSNYGQSGKLTLNEIVVYEDKGMKLFPSYAFSYNASNSVKNPDYNVLKHDYWGYYKSDYTTFGSSHYTTPASSDDADSWSLKEILTPVGSKIKVTYESDDYVKEGYSDDPNPSIFGLGQVTDVQNIANTMFGTTSPSDPNKNKPSIVIPVYSIASLSSKNFEFSDYGTSVTSNLNTLVNSGTSQNPIHGKLKVLPLISNCSPATNQPQPSYPYSYLVSNGFYTYYLYISSGSNFYGESLFPPSAVNMCYDVPAYPSPNQTYSTIRNYDKTIMSGYHYSNFTKLNGGGIRVKQIEFIDPTNNETFKREYLYEGGYAPVVPKPLMLGGVNAKSGLQLWTNYNNQMPYTNLSRVGYSKVICKNYDKFGNSNGRTENSFENSVMPNPLQTSVGRSDDNVIQSPTWANCSNSSYYTCSSLFIKKKKVGFHFWNTFSTDRLCQIGKILSTKVIDNDDKTLFTKSFNYKVDNEITEKYPDNWSPWHNVSYVQTCNSNTSPYSAVSVYCNWEEIFCHQSSSKNFNSILKSVTTSEGEYNSTNYLQRQEFFTYDPHNMDIILTESKSNTMGKIVTNKIYAYASSSNASMGYKCDNESYKNMVMVAEKVGTTKYLKEENIDATNVNGFILSESVNTFKSTAKYLKYDPYTAIYSPVSETKNWPMVDESYKRLTNDNNLISPWSAAAYRLEGKTNLFNSTNRVIETIGLNGRKSAIKYGYNNTFPLASIANANYYSFAFSGFEDTITVAPGVVHFGGEVQGGNLRSKTVMYNGDQNYIVKPHTGDYFAKVTGSVQNLIKIKDFDRTRKYATKIWVHKAKSATNAAYDVPYLRVWLEGFKDGSNNPITAMSLMKFRNDPENVVVGDWILMSLDFDLPANAVGTEGTITIQFGSNYTAFIDDFKFHPVDEPIVGNVYDYRTGRLIANLNSENFASFYNYDAAGRIINEFQETKGNGVVKALEKSYHNSRQ